MSKLSLSEAEGMVREAAVATADLGTTLGDAPLTEETLMSALLALGTISRILTTHLHLLRIADDCGRDE